MDKKQILELRHQLGLSQKELAARLKIDAITVSRWERGIQKPDKTAIKRLERLAKKASKAK